ncbi:MAG TPA: TIGR03936 family radical SAM-associated protein [Anaerolineales bacterium]|nr:TIGR03936 family radical SAM-associated protein [Anaerolineales bacterium]
MRIRITFSKTEAMRYTGHLDLHRTWERTFRRAALPLAYSQGFHPQPRLNLACALPLGFTSHCEVLDAWLEIDLPLAEIEAQLSPALPPGLVLQSMAQVDNHAPALQTQVQSADYTVSLLDTPADLQSRLDTLLSSTNILRERRGKSYDLRPLIEHLEYALAASDAPPCLLTRLAAREGATGRPEELLAALGIPFENTRIHRTRLYGIE